MTRADFHIWLFLATVWVVACVAMWVADRLDHWRRTKRLLRRQV